ncbi:MAG: hypothetical protein AAB361_01390 [Patescibacteria group bacterium]
MKKWEYKRIEIIDPKGGFRKKVDVLSDINKAGKQGWRILPLSIGASESMCLMEREIPEPPNPKKNMYSGLTPQRD